MAPNLQPVTQANFSVPPNVIKEACNIVAKSQKQAEVFIRRMDAQVCSPVTEVRQFYVAKRSK